MAVFKYTYYVGGKALDVQHGYGCMWWRAVPQERGPEYGHCAAQDGLNQAKRRPCAHNTTGETPLKCPIRRLKGRIEIRVCVDAVPDTLDLESIEQSRATAQADLDAARQHDVP